MAKNKKLIVEFEPPSEQMDEVVAKAYITQLMTTITQIGIRVDNPEYDIMKKEKTDDTEN